MENKTWVKAIKGFNEDLTCNPKGITFQYEEGETYKEDSCKLCESGFHACEAPIDVFRYYPPAKSVYHQVELSGVSSESSNDTKICGNEIRIGAKINIAHIAKMQFDFVRKNCTNENNAEKGKPATAGEYGAATAGKYGAATAGNSGAATAGEYGAATAGFSGAATAGFSGAATAGNSGAATAGDRGAATAGNSGAATAGEYGAATAGNSGAATAGNGGAAAAGEYGAATAGNGGAATAGFRGAATAGFCGAATAGNRGAATAGNRGAATAGFRGAATARGSVTVGDNGVGTVRGSGVKIRGGIGALLVAAEEHKDNYDIVTWATAIVDGEKIKANTWYCVKDGEFLEVEQNGLL